MTVPPGDYHIAQLNITTLLAPIDDPSIAALKEFAYRTEHAAFFARRREWFVPGSSGVALWWTRAGDLPTLVDAKRRLEFLERHGPSPYAFRFARPPRRRRSSSSRRRSRIPTHSASSLT